METAVIVLVAGGGGGGAIFTVSTAPLSPVVEQTEGDEERDEDEGDREDEVTLRAAHLMRGREVSLGLSLPTELLALGGVEDVRGVGALAAVGVTGANHPLPPHPSYPLPSTSRPG